jgi:hypothetical protein
MYLIRDQRFGETYLVFTWQDPRKDGYAGEDVEEVALDYVDSVNDWADSAQRPEVCVGRSPIDPLSYKVFKYTAELRSCGFELIEGTLVICARWSDYIRILRKPPKPAQLGEVGWYDFVDDVDESSQELSRRDDSDAPQSQDRDAIAAWVARKHFVADGGIREIWYLPHGAPPDEIRLLELSDRVHGGASEVEPIDFGLDVDGGSFRLVVADVTSDQLEQVKKNPSRLPAGWSLDGNRVWGRRGA